MTHPAVSIITVCKNAQNTIEPTIRSVLSQTYAPIEYIVIDGNSSDGTMDIIRGYNDRIAKIICEPDSGIYDAMNKGIATANGDILYFLNAGDRLYTEHTVETIVNELDNTDALILYGKSAYEHIPKELEKRYPPHSYIFNKKIDVARHNSPQQCFFYRKKAFDLIGLFDTTFKIAADMDWFLRSIDKKIPRHFIDEFVCVCDLTGVSSSAHVHERVIAFRNNMNIFEFINYSLFAIARQCKRFIKGERLN